MNLVTLRRTAAEIAAAAVTELFPNVELWGGGETSSGFFCDFSFPHPIHPETIPMIEERIRQIVREKREIRTLEMVPFSARELLLSRGQKARAEELAGVAKAEGLVELVQIGRFANLSPGPHLKNTAELAAFKIFSLDPLEGKGVRLMGCAAPSKEQLKEFLKKWNAYVRSNHETVGEGLGLWFRSVEEFVWQGRGLELRKRAIDFLKKQMFKGVWEVQGPQEISPDRERIHRSALEAKGVSRIGEVWVRREELAGEAAGLFTCPEETLVQVSVFSSQASRGLGGGIFEECISCLQTIGETLNILGFNYCIRLVGRKQGEKSFLNLQNALQELGWKAEKEIQPERRAPRVLFLVEDGLGRQWPAFEMQWMAGKESRSEGFWFAASVEKIIAFLLEKYIPEKNCEEWMNKMGPL